MPLQSNSSQFLVFFFIWCQYHFSAAVILSLQHWRELCILNRTLKWIKADSREGVTVARCKFGKNRRGYAMLKVEGVLEADPDTVYHFLKISTKEGGKVKKLWWWWVKEFREYFMGING